MLVPVWLQQAHEKWTGCCQDNLMGRNLLSIFTGWGCKTYREKYWEKVVKIEKLLNVFVMLRIVLNKVIKTIFKWWWWLFSTAFKGLFYFWIYCNGEYFQFWRILIKHWGKNMQTQIKKTTCKSESDQIGFFLLEAISLPLPYRITFTFKLAFPNLDSGHYQGGATTLGKITPPRTDSSHRN